MASQSKNFIVRQIRTLRNNQNIPGVARVKFNDDETVCDIHLDGRKYIGRMRLEWHGDRFTVYLVDKEVGKVVTGDYSHAKGAYLSIKTAADARLFTKWYELTAQLAAMKRTRAA